VSNERIIGLYETFGPRRIKHKVVLYLNLLNDWGAIQLERNGNKGRCLAWAKMTKEADEYLATESPHRALSLQYNDCHGVGGLEADLRSFAYDECTIKKFTDAASIAFGTHPEQLELSGENK